MAKGAAPSWWPILVKGEASVFSIVFTTQAIVNLRHNLFSCRIAIAFNWFGSASIRIQHHYRAGALWMRLPRSMAMAVRSRKPGFELANGGRSFGQADGISHPMWN